MQTILVLAFASSLISASPTIPDMGGALSVRQSGNGLPPLTFDCADIPEVCENMCWGACCTQGPSFPQILDYDKPDNNKKEARRTTAGCSPRPNRCSPIQDQNCDEYPFASTTQADAGGQVNRCVPMKQNNRQGSAISAYTRVNCNSQPCRYDVGFANIGGVKYCDAYKDRARLCKADGKIYKNGQPDVDWQASNTKRTTEPVFEGGLYMTESGIEVFFAFALEPGARIQNAIARKRARSNRYGSGRKGANSTISDIKYGANSTILDIKSGANVTDFEFSEFEEEWQGMTPPEIDLIDDVIAYKID